MYYSHNLRSNLQEWRNRLYKSTYENINNNYRFFISRLEETAIIQAILQNALDNNPLSDEELQTFYDTLTDGGDMGYRDEADQAAFLYRLHKKFKAENSEGKALAFTLGSGREFSDQLDNFLDIYVQPICTYIHEQLEESNSTLFLIEKYKRRIEWFYRTDLKTKYENAASNYEKIFEDDLRLFLFDQGIDYPFSTPSSASGRADIVGLIDTKNPLVLEIKIYDTTKGYRKNRISEGFAQTVKYANDYNKNVGYLVVFNLDDIQIEIESGDADNNFPNRIVFNNKVFYIVIINLYNDATASKAGSLKYEIITKEDLIAVTSQ